MPEKPLKYRDLRRILASFGVEELAHRGKGSHRMFSAVIEGRPNRYPVKCHNENQEFSRSIVAAIRRRFELTEEHGISDDNFYGR